jgi:hypothetical protein
MFKSKFFTPKSHSKWLIYDCAFSALVLFQNLYVNITEKSNNFIMVYFSSPAKVDSNQVTILALVLTST